MPLPAKDPREYFLGIEGDQTGPFPTHTILQKIIAGEIPREALVWAEGMRDWKPIHTVGIFGEAFQSLEEASITQVESLEEPPPPPPPPSALKFAPLDHEEDRKPKAGTSRIGRNRKDAGDELEPVFSSEDAVFSDSPFVRYRILFVLGGIVVMAGAAAAGFYYYASKKPAILQAPLPNSKTSNFRQNELNRALSQMLLQPDQSLQTLKALAITNSEDSVGKEAIQAGVDYLKRQQRFVEAGKFLMEVKQPAQAAENFLVENNANKEASDAFFAAYELAKDPVQKKNYLLRNIKLLLHPVNDVAKAVENIQLFQKQFPNEPHPFGYYLRTTDEKIADLFQRISFHFVQSLMSYLSTELPEINLAERPLIEIRKTKNNEYRIVGTYKGDVLLNRDKMPNVYLMLWMVNDNWVIVDTNLTKERKRFAVAEKEKAQAKVMNADQMLRYMEDVFHSQFPKNALHEMVAPQAPNRPTRIDQ